jgi:hypothetical protein
MDSKNIYIACQHNLRNIIWDKSDDTEWTYIGLESEFNEQNFFKMISEFFKEENVYSVIDRHNAFEIKSHAAIPEILRFLKENNVILSSKDFTRMIEISKIGVARKGKKKQDGFPPARE